ncbi:hypothetical protein DOK67_0001300 [Enterococcus sp. DIV0212c]|uniref:collagen binding domain-containing protein n=1 Tax=Enterococcus sp. DIV0212c TaxID=2230867 RepID=UPI001A9AABE6|nr:collagen binding domain-containing protein [Enterococcus sp. DIV0212c]MBO1353578.1 LPXTG cell wall anchor domain-containing protein [Enterococcus sp. DIV0212c]
MLKKLSWYLVMVVGFLGVFGISEHSSAAELNNGGFVDTIQFDKTELMNGELTSIHVTFSEKAGMKLKAGDELTLSLPKELEGLAESNDVPREIDLNGLGIVRVYKDKVICIFNEKVNQLDRVRGEFTFGVRVTNVEENTVKEVPVNLGTSVSVQNIIVKGQTGIYEEREKPFFYKTGDLLGKSGQIRWFLSANLNKSDLAADIVMTDQSGGGQLLNKDSFAFTIDNYLGQSTLSLEEFQNQGYGTVEFGAENAFVIRIYREKARLSAFTIMYTANITEAGKKQANFTNDCQIDYRLLYEKAISETATHQVKNIFLDGNAIGDENQPIKEAIEQEEVIEDESNELGEITPLDPEEQAKETQEEELNKAKEEQPEIHVGEQIETNEDESNELGEITPLDPEEQAKETQEEELNKAKEEQPEIHVGEQIETNEDESNELGEITPLDPEEQAKETQEEELNKAKEEQPEIHVGEQIETNEDESNELGEITPLDPEEQAKETQEEELNKAKVEQPEIKIGEPEEVIEDKPNKLEKIKPFEQKKPELKEINALRPVVKNTQSNEGLKSDKEKLSIQSDPFLLTDAKPTNGQLPKAGSSTSYAFVLVGFAMSTLATSAFIFNRKKYNN